MALPRRCRKDIHPGQASWTGRRLPAVPGASLVIGSKGAGANACGEGDVIVHAGKKREVEGVRRGGPAGGPSDTPAHARAVDPAVDDGRRGAAGSATVVSGVPGPGAWNRMRQGRAPECRPQPASVAHALSIVLRSTQGIVMILHIMPCVRMIERMLWM